MLWLDVVEAIVKSGTVVEVSVTAFETLAG
jgi:hypothetical protein